MTIPSADALPVFAQHAILALAPVIVGGFLHRRLVRIEVHLKNGSNHNQEEPQ